MMRLSRSFKICLVLFGFVFVGLANISRSDAASFQGLGDLTGVAPFDSVANAASADGSVVVGRGTNSNSDKEAFRWTSGGGMEPLGDLPDGPFNSVAWGVSADGSVVVGNGKNSNSKTEAFRWTSGDGMEGLGDLLGGGSSSFAGGVSADGSVVVGGSVSALGFEAFHWTSGGVPKMVGIGDLEGGTFNSFANGVSADGSVVVGRGRSESGIEAFRWENGVMKPLGDLAGGMFNSAATGISADGSVVVGIGRSESGIEAFRWTDEDGMVGLGDLNGAFSTSWANGVSADGSVVVGGGSTGSGIEALIWDAVNGMQNLQLVLNDLGADTTGWILREARGISADGLTIVGLGENPSGDTEAWIAQLATTIAIDIKPRSCPNPLNVKSKGTLPVAIVGTGTFDVWDIDVNTVRLNGVPPIRSSYEDVTHWAIEEIDNDPCFCEELVPDTYVDLVFKFNTKKIVASLEDEVQDGQEVPLTLIGKLIDGTPIKGSDCVLIKK